MFELKMLDRMVRTLDIVRHVANLKRNLISLTTLYSKGYKFIGEGGVLKVYKGAHVVLEGERRSRMYVSQGHVESSKIISRGLLLLVDVQFGAILLEFGFV